MALIAAAGTNPDRIVVEESVQRLAKRHVAFWQNRPYKESFFQPGQTLVAWFIVIPTEHSTVGIPGR